MICNDRSRNRGVLRNRKHEACVVRPCIIIESCSRQSALCDSWLSLPGLLDRGHRELPIRPDYVGKNLPILAPGLAGAIEAAWAIAETLGGAKPLDIQATASDAGLDIDVRGSGPLNATQSVALA